MAKGNTLVEWNLVSLIVAEMRRRFCSSGVNLARLDSAEILDRLDLS